MFQVYDPSGPGDKSLLCLALVVEVVLLDSVEELKVGISPCLTLFTVGVNDSELVLFQTMVKVFDIESSCVVVKTLGNIACFICTIINLNIQSEGLF